MRQQPTTHSSPDLLATCDTLSQSRWCLVRHPDSPPPRPTRQRTGKQHQVRTQPHWQHTGPPGSSTPYAPHHHPTYIAPHHHPTPPYRIPQPFITMRHHPICATAVAASPAPVTSRPTNVGYRTYTGQIQVLSLQDCPQATLPHLCSRGGSFSSTRDSSLALLVGSGHVSHSFLIHSCHSLGPLGGVG